MTKISWTVNVQVAGGPKAIAQSTTEVEAYDQIDVAIPAAGVETQVALTPGGAGLVNFLLLTADKYANLTYSVNDTAANTGASYTFDGPQLLIGAGSVGLLDADVRSLYFTNADANVEAKVHILLGRDATP